ncbi:MAG: Y4yA family PLP-dependent enzyme, partial [Patescibacteria group bacterium]|nr:Y4yA family PLP-dependent enzyme [Patescibacteria group bacterium]
MYPLTPIISPRIRAILSQREQICSWIRAFGSPLNLVFPEAVWENAQQFLSILQQNNIRGTIFYAHKANKSKAILAELATKNISVDVASEQELCHAPVSYTH